MTETASQAADLQAQLVRTSNAEEQIDESAIRVVEDPERSRAAVEIDDGATELAEIRSVRNEEGVITVRRGRSTETVEKLANEFRSQLQSTTAIGSDDLSVQLDRPESPEPIRFVAAVYSDTETSVLRALVGLELRVQGDEEEERRLLTSADVANARTASYEGSSGVQIRVTDNAADRVVQTLRDTGALASPDDHFLQVYDRNERIWEAPLGNGLAQAMRSGAWTADPSIVFRTESEQNADQLAQAAGLLSSAIQMDMALDECE